VSPDAQEGAESRPWWPYGVPRIEGVKTNGPLEENASLERMRSELVEAENALARASNTAERLGPSGTTEWDQGRIKPIRYALSELINDLDDRIMGPGD
jgi:hypothetical protein